MRYKTALLMTLSLLCSFTSAVFAEKIALVQHTANDSFGDYQENIRMLTDYAIQAAEQGAKIIAFPEGSTWGYQSSEGDTWCSDHAPTSPKSKRISCHDVHEIVEAVPSGDTTSHFVSLAKELRIFIVFFVVEIQAGEIYRTAVIAGPHGYVGKYQKRHLWENEKWMGAALGSDGFVLETPWGRLGVLICFDIWFGHVEEYKSEAVDAILLLSDWAGVPAVPYFKKFASQHRVDFFATDDRYTGGTGFYPAGRRVHLSNGISYDQDGFSMHEFDYSRQ